jgi:transketolase
MRNRLGKYLVEFADKDSKLILLVGDIGFGIFDEFIEKHPDKFINCGIAEQNMIGTAAGLASNGFHVVVYTIIPFLLYRPFDFVRNLIAHQNIPVCLIGVGGGFVYDNLGFTHYAKEDLNLISSLPNFKILTPFDPNSAQNCFESAFSFDKPTYIRLMKGGEETIESFNNKKGYSIISDNGNDFTIFTYGSIVSQILIAVDKLIENNVFGKVIAITDIEICTDFILNYRGKKIIIEEHLPPGLILSKLIEFDTNVKLDFLTMFISRNNNQTVADRQIILKQQNLDPISIFNRIKEFI